MDRMDSTDSATEKYPVCPERNTPAAFRWFYQPLSVLTFLRPRSIPRPAAPGPASVQPAPARKQA
jgi:hypothetical protein